MTQMPCRTFVCKHCGSMTAIPEMEKDKIGVGCDRCGSATPHWHYHSPNRIAREEARRRRGMQ